MSGTRYGSASKGWAALVLAACCVLMAPAANAGVVALSGHVTSHLAGMPLADVRVSIVTFASHGLRIEIGNAITDAGGAYAWTGDCESSFFYCEVIVDDPPYLSASGSFEQDAGVAVVDLALLTPATASGTLRFPGGLPAGIAIDADRYVAESGSWEMVSGAYVASDGTFSIGALPPDTYRFCTMPTDNGAVLQCFDHVNLPPIAGDPPATLVDVAEGAAVAGIDFDLVLGGTLSGTIYDGYLGVPLEDNFGQLIAYDINGDALIYGEIDGLGTFRVRGLPDGTYYLGVNTGGPFADAAQFYPGVVCTTVSCPPPTSGTPLTILGADEIDGLDFTVHPQVVVSGRVLDAGSGTGLGGIDVGLYDFAGHAMTMSAAGTGAYRFYWYADLPFQVGAFDAPPRIDAVYPDANCLGTYCVGDATTLNEPSGTVRSDIDLSMQIGAVVSGHTPGGEAAIVLYDADYNAIWSGYSDYSTGTYAINAWLPGTYYVEALGLTGLSGCAFYLDRPCPDSGGSPADVDPTPITVVAGVTRSDIDFQLPPADSIFANGFDP
jgi:hypothetical protein